MKIYLAGPMRGIPLLNFPRFGIVASEFRKMGHEVFNPAERDVVEDHFDPAKDTPRPIKEYMQHDLAVLCMSDRILLLDGWEKSQGAKLEKHVADELGIPAIDERGCFIGGKEVSVLQEAEALINGDRQASYGPPDQDFQRTATMWNGLLKYRLKEGHEIRPQDVAWMMIMLKASRAQHSDKRDNYVDAAGYSGCGWKCVEAENEREERDHSGN